MDLPPYKPYGLIYNKSWHTYIFTRDFVVNMYVCRDLFCNITCDYIDQNLEEKTTNIWAGVVLLLFYNDTWIK